MTFSKLLQGPSRIVTSIGPSTDIIRLAPGRVEPEFRKVNITFAPVTARRKYLYPWREDQVMEMLDITATIKLRNGRTYRISKLVRLSFEKAVEFVTLEVVKTATMDKMQQLDNRLCG